MDTQSQGGKAVVKVLIVLVIVVAGYLIWAGATNSPSASPSPTVSSTATPEASISVSPSVTPTPAAASVKTFDVSGKPFSFTPGQIKVKKGDTVKIVFKNEQGTHDWVIDEFNARTKILQAGQSETIQFVADKTGTFEYYCSVGTHRQMGMKGSLIVE